MWHRHKQLQRFAQVQGAEQVHCLRLTIGAPLLIEFWLWAVSADLDPRLLLVVVRHVRQIVGCVRSRQRDGSLVTAVAAQPRKACIGVVGVSPSPTRVTARCRLGMGMQPGVLRHLRALPSGGGMSSTQVPLERGRLAASGPKPVPDAGLAARSMPRPRSGWLDAGQRCCGRDPQSGCRLIDDLLPEGWQEAAPTGATPAKLSRLTPRSGGVVPVQSQCIACTVPVSLPV